MQLLLEFVDPIHFLVERSLIDDPALRALNLLAATLIIPLNDLVETALAKISILLGCCLEQSFYIRHLLTFS